MRKLKLSWELFLEPKKVQGYNMAFNKKLLHMKYGPSDEDEWLSDPLKIFISFDEV